MTTISKIKGLTRSQISSVSGVSLSNIESINDNTRNTENDFTWGKSQGTLSAWINLNNMVANSAGRNFICFHDGDTITFANFLMITLFKQTSNTYGLLGRQRRTVNNIQYDMNVISQQSSTNHGRPWERISTSSYVNVHQSYGSSGNNPVNLVEQNVWIQVVYTWDNTDSYTYPIGGVNTYYGNQKIYVNSTLQGYGQSIAPGHGANGNPSPAHTTTAGGSAPPNRTINFSHLNIGALNPRTHTLADMLINDIAIWDVALNQANVTAIYNSRNPIDLTSNSGNYDKSDKLAGYWKFEDNYNDSSGNSNNLTASGSPTFSTNRVNSSSTIDTKSLKLDNTPQGNAQYLYNTSLEEIRT